MNKFQILNIPRSLGPLILLSALPLPLQAVTIFSENFSGTSADLNGTTPDIGTGNWIASANFNADGSTDDGAGSATLAFTPSDGLIYQLDVSLSGLGRSATATSVENDWLAMGFANGQSTESGNNDRFIATNVSGVAWMFTRGDTTQDPETISWLGTGDLGGGNTGLAGLSVATEMGTLDSIDMRIILDTTGGAAVTNWSATWQAKLPGDPAYTTLRTENLLAGTTIGSVGLARSNSGITGTVESFSLTSIPEPSSAALLGLAGLSLLRRRR